MAKPTKEALLSQLDYDQKTGKLVWKITKGRKIAGQEAGWFDNLGYRLTRFDGVLYRNHHIVVFLETGVWPLGDVDHIDGNPSNNAITNLRVCSHAQNQRNMRKHKDNTSGFKGVYWSKQCEKWMAKIVVGGKQKHLGLFVDKQKAAQAYDKAAAKIHGEFAKLNGV